MLRRINISEGISPVVVVLLLYRYSSEFHMHAAECDVVGILIRISLCPLCPYESDFFHSFHHVVSFLVDYEHAKTGKTRLFAKQTTDSAENTVLLGVVRVVFARDLENGGEGRGVGVDSVPYPISNLFYLMLVNSLTEEQRQQPMPSTQTSIG